MAQITSIIADLGKTSSVTAKHNILVANSDNHVFLDVLRYAYEPRWKYYTRATDLIGTGTMTIENAYSLWTDLFDDLRKRVVTGYAAQERLLGLFKLIAPSDGVILKRILQKDLRAGINVTSINNSIPRLLKPLKFMKALKYAEGQVHKYPYLYMSLKIDCIRGLLRDGVIYTTTGKEANGVQHLVESVPYGIDLDMELTIPGLAFDKASGQIRSLKDCPTVIGMVFDIPSVPESFDIRYKTLQDLFSEDRPGLKLLEHKRVANDVDIFRNYNKALAAGYEGLVLKTPHHHYQERRSADWLKVKPEDPESVKIVDFLPGTGKYADILGSVVCKRKNGVLVRAGGFTDAMRAEIWNNKDKWRGAIIDVRAHMETPDGSLRHARFHRERWDLNSL